MKPKTKDNLPRFNPFWKDGAIKFIHTNKKKYTRKDKHKINLY